MRVSVRHSGFVLVAFASAAVATAIAVSSAVSSAREPNLRDRRAPSSAPIAGQASCAVLTPRQERAAAEVVVVGKMLRGRTSTILGRPVLLSPARLRVDRYLKGSGPRMVAVQTGVRLVNGQIQVQEDGILPSPGQRWKIFSSSRRTPLRTSVCSGSRWLDGE